MSRAAPTHESSLLLTLEEISQLVSRSRDPGETLANIVKLIQGRFHTDVCSVYFLEAASNELVLGATIGLQPESVGRVRMRLDEGLTGLVAERMAPVTVDDAFQHPRFKYFPEAGEDPYHSFLGVPLIEGGALQGVLVVQTVEARRFTPNEIRMLIAVAAQLAPLASEARLLQQVVAAAHQNHEAIASQIEMAAPAALHGLTLSPGIGVGQSYLVDSYLERQCPERRAADPQVEQRRLTAAVAAAHEEITRQSQRISALVGEDHGAILQAQLLIMQDRAIEQDLSSCLEAGSSAEEALIQTLDKYVAVFQKLTTPFFQERAYDIKDVFRRILWHLGPQRMSTRSVGDRLVLVSREASVMELFAVDLDRLAAVVVEHGGPQSHAAILARSLGVPMVGQLPDGFARIRPDQPLLVDGNSGLVWLDPAPELLAVHRPVQALRPPPLQAPVQPQVAGIALPRVEANVNLLCEADQAVAEGAKGVGLYRTEFLFLARRTFPSEEEQVSIYRKLLGRLPGLPASIRTFDLRPDKLAHHAQFVPSAGRSLDWRRVLDSPPLQKLFKDQVRAILRAAAAGPARMVVPLVTRTEQLDFVIETIAQARDELHREELDQGEHVPLGVMIEVAAAAPLIETWAAQVDFFALGTNDLAASALGLDRDDPANAGSDDLLHPGLLRLIHDAVRGAHGVSRPVTVCGEMAADTDGALALATFGVDSLSVPVNQLSAVQERLATQSHWIGKELREALLVARTAEQARTLLRNGSG
jgi:phosphotransferase system enzyme I (PtsP)